MIEKLFSLPTIADGEDKSSPLGNRIRKNYRHIRKWAKRTETNCFRLYNHDIRNYPLIIDFYDGHFCVHYLSRKTDSDFPPPELVEETTHVLCAIFGLSSASIHWRTRAKSKENRQYEKIGEQQQFFYVLEYGVKFKVNLVDYLDTGLFLDHRETRQIVAARSQGKRLLNLFAYTCSFSVHAAVAGACFTKSVDMSNTYTEWGKDNLKLNGIPLHNHPVIRADCLKFLEEEVRSGIKYDVIVIDPPTISRSKKMDQLFDIQVDYPFLVSCALQLLNPDGIIFFSTNSRKFTFDIHLFPTCTIEDITHKTIPIDFRDEKIHRCWTISKTPNSGYKQ
jgi:23S rRNA G2069 N7-methylase RlmK/C1962 C5-methylase RlmI